MKRAFTGFWSMLTVAVLALPACDTGGDIVAGIDRGGLQGGAVGTITGFGSVIVNDVHYGTEGADIVVNGVPATEAELEVGYVVVISADIPVDGSAPSATSIEFSHDVTGPVTSVDAAKNRFVVLGQTISIDDATLFGAGIEPASVDGLEALPVMQIVRISGLSGASGSLLATRVELGAAGAELEITGTVANVDTGAGTLQIGGLVVDYSSANLDGFSGGQPMDGDRVKAEGARFSVGGALLAREVERKDIELALVDGDELEVEGLITSFASTASFSVAGFPVVTGPQTQFEHGDATMLELDVRVEVEGSVDADGVLVADEVEFGVAGDARVEAPAEAVDATAGTLILLGITVSADAATSFEDKSTDEPRPFGLGDIVPGNPLRVRGIEDAGAPGTLRATLVQLGEPLEELVIRGVATNVSAPQFTVLGVTVLTDGQTDMEADFFATAEGRLVHVEGDTTTGSFVAEKVEIKD